MTDFEIAVQRLTAWVRDYGDHRLRSFVGDISIVLLAAQDTPRQQQKIEQLQGIIRVLRQEWFVRHLASRAPEREWEDEARGNLRASQNDTLRAQYDEQTEALLQGQNVPLTPTCGYDMAAGGE